MDNKRFAITDKIEYLKKCFVSLLFKPFNLLTKLFYICFWSSCILILAIYSGCYVSCLIYNNVFKTSLSFSPMQIRQMPTILLGCNVALFVFFSCVYVLLFRLLLVIMDKGEKCGGR